MPNKFIKIVFIFFVSFLIVNCTSVEQFNKKLSTPIPVERLQKDIDFTQHKLEKLYPNLYGYISKEQLNAKFDSIRNVVSKPMTSKEFYFVISPVIASVRQGHMTMSPVLQRIPKKEAKRLKKAGEGPFSQFGYEWQNDKLYIIKNKSKNKIVKVGAEVVSVNSITPQSLYKKYRKSFTSDGFNSTFLRKFFSKRYQTFMLNEIGINDSLTFVFKQKDSVFTQIISRNKPIKVFKSNDTTKVIAKATVDKSKLKTEKKRKKVYGFDKTSNEYIKQLKFVESDSSVAVLKIKNFSQGRYYTAYERIFDSIKKRDCKTLIIDIRDNPGGRVADVVDLYSYLTDKEYIILQPADVTSKTSLWRTGVFKQIPKITYPFMAAVYPIYMGFSYFRTTKKEDGSFQYKLTGARKEKSSENHFSGKIYVLINGGSFSASCILSSSLKSNPNVTFVGEETGGSFNGTVAGVTPIVNLPNSKIPLRLGLMNIKTVNQTEVFGRGIFPDKEITQTIDDKINNKDPEIEWILNDIKKK
jgi:hypothetical protein